MTISFCSPKINCEGLYGQNNALQGFVQSIQKMDFYAKMAFFVFFFADVVNTWLVAIPRPFGMLLDEKNAGFIQRVSRISLPATRIPCRTYREVFIAHSEFECQIRLVS
ncbi:hypothetical protein SU60_07405 [Vibrio mytili]|uniref:Uncharacterized protein n=1 Tax=Vibrio mytili TaxID=50718 RepID=A0A0C3I8U0_9VIBR|nr:hypothetical protein SU60_07405 [Vibrio mytili]